MMHTIIPILLGLILLLMCIHTLIRILRHYYMFPMPHFMANLIDNPRRRLIQPQDATSLRHGIEPGMTVLDVGPGNGAYMLAFSELFPDPDYQQASTLIRKTTRLGFMLKKKIGNFFCYTLVFEKD